MPNQPSPQPLVGKTIEPIAACAIYGIIFHDGKFWAIDKTNGYLLEVDPETNNTKVLNPHHRSFFVGATGLAIVENTIWFAAKENIYFCPLNNPDSPPQLFQRLAYTAQGIAIYGATIYITSPKTGEIIVLSRTTGKKITSFYSPGIGIENITVKDEEIWLCDDLEQTVYCLERATGEVIFQVLTPFTSPTGLTFATDATTGKEILYVAYANLEPYIRDNPNTEPNYELQYRDRTFLHPLSFYYDRESKYVLSNGYLLEMSYVEELAPLDDIKLEDLEWRIALPAETNRQKLVKIEPIGLPFTMEEREGQKIAVFKFDRLTKDDRYIFGWKALLEVWSIKYQILPKDCEKLPPLPSEYVDRYLADNDNLAMDTDIIQEAAKEAIARETNYLRKIYSIRSYVYDKLSYGIKPHIDTPDLVLRRGVGSCGEYLGVLLALSRLNGIPCRTVGRYKCPQQPRHKNVPLVPDFNHVWMEFYLPDCGWLPMESNPDDLFEGGPYPTRFFMGLAWYHAEIAKEIPFQTLTSQGKLVDKEKVSISNLAINHIRFMILSELGFD
jgi:transglutaminase-like putative cysteine protease